MFVKSRVMDFVAANGGAATRSQIVKFIIEVVQGRTYDKKRIGNYYHDAFKNPHGTKIKEFYWTDVEIGHFMKPGYEKRHLKLEDGLYKLVD
jgi:hypothetical protein